MTVRWSNLDATALTTQVPPTVLDMSLMARPLRGGCAGGPGGSARAPGISGGDGGMPGTRKEFIGP